MAKKESAREEFEISEEAIKPYFSGHKKHKNYAKALDYYQHMSFHFDGYFLTTAGKDDNGNQTPGFGSEEKETNKYFARLIDMRRPSESDSIKAYRRTVYLPLSQAPCFKVYNSLRKIVKAPDWKIDYSKVAKPAGIADGEYLEDYCEKNYPQFNSVENWFYNYGMRNMLVDANALIYVIPRNPDKEENEYYEPVATIVHCKDVLDFKEDEYCIFRIDRDYEYKSANTWRKGKLLGIITKEGYWEVKQVKDKGDFVIEQIMEFKMEYMPAWIIGGVVKKYTSEYTLYNSFMAPMLPGLDGMAMALTDEEAEWVQHIYSTMWYFSQQDCRHCMGKGRVNGRGKQLITCSECNGTGNAPKSPYRDMVLKSGAFDQDKLPTPPAGYIQKQTEIVKLFKEKIEKKEWTALSAINHEFLAEVPLVQSGVSKQYDRQELENYTYSVAYHSVENVLNDVYYFINEFRYMGIVTSEEERLKMLPKISIPIKFDLINAAVIEAQLKAARESKVDAEIIDQIELEYVTKQFPNEPELRDKIKLKKRLDPFPGLTPEEKQNLLLSKTADPIDVIVSIYLHPFIERALVEDEDFCHEEYPKQIETIYKFAEEKMSKLDEQQKEKDKQKIDMFKKTAMVNPGKGLPMNE